MRIPSFSLSLNYVVILLAVTDERALRFNPLLVKHQASTYISLTEGAFSDFAENSVESTG